MLSGIILFLVMVAIIVLMIRLDFWNHFLNWGGFVEDDAREDEELDALNRQIFYGEGREAPMSPDPARLEESHFDSLLQGVLVARYRRDGEGLAELFAQNAVYCNADGRFRYDNPSTLRSHFAGVAHGWDKVEVSWVHRYYDPASKTGIGLLRCEAEGEEYGIAVYVRLDQGKIVEWREYRGSLPDRHRVE